MNKNISSYLQPGYTAEYDGFKAEVVTTRPVEDYTEIGLNFEDSGRSVIQAKTMTEFINTFKALCAKLKEERDNPETISIDEWLSLQGEI